MAQSNYAPSNDHLTQIKAIRATKQAEADKQALEAQKAVQVPIYAVGCELYRPIVAQYDWDVNTMMRVMSAESGCNPYKDNPTDTHRNQYGQVICYGSWGLLQIGCVHGYSQDEMHNPTANILAAYKVWNGGNYKAWSTY